MESVIGVCDIDFEILENREEQSIADRFNLYYVHSIHQIIGSIEEVEITISKSIHVMADTDMLRNFEPINVGKLEHIVKGLTNKKGTEEGISSDILKIALNVIKVEFMSLVNKSLEVGKFPDDWKTSIIVPIPKISKPKKVSEFRPINILPMYEKILEIVVKEQIEKYLENNNGAPESGFRKFNSCETAIQASINDWKIIISERKIIGVIFIDLKRAFETVDRKRLLEKLYQL